MTRRWQRITYAATFTFVFVITSTSGTWAQGDAPPIEPQPLKIVSAEVVEGIPATAFLGPESCDQKQNIFLRPGVLSKYGAIIAKIDPDGKLVSQYDITKSSPDVDLSAFFINREGEVFASGYTDREAVADHGRTGFYVFAFAKDGTLRNKIKLDADLGALGPIAVFTSGKMLLTATDESDPQGRKAFNAIFDSDGKLVKKLTFADDEQIEKAIAGHDDSVVPNNPAFANDAVTLGVAVPGPNDSVYLLRHSNPATIYQVDAAGNLLKTLTVRSDHVGSFAANLLESQGRLAVVFGRWGSADTDIKVIDANTGDVVADYTDDFGGPTCFSAPAEFVVTGLKDGKMLLRRATP